MDVFLTKHNRHSYSTALAELGYRYCASGAFATVYSHAHENHVLKVFSVSNNSAYITYLGLLSEISDKNPWKPKIYDVKMFVSHKDEPFMVVCMEKLNTLSRREGDSLEDQNNFFKKRKQKNASIKILGYSQAGAAEILKAVFSATMVYGEDIHAGNVMKRSNGEYVMTDPLC